MITELVEKVERLKNICLSRATGGQDDPEYVTIRRELIDNPTTCDLLPRFIRTCGDSDQFRQFIQTQFDTYDERRRYINDEFLKSITFVQEGGQPDGTSPTQQPRAPIDQPSDDHRAVEHVPTSDEVARDTPNKGKSLDNDTANPVQGVGPAPTPVAPKIPEPAVAIIHGSANTDTSDNRDSTNTRPGRGFRSFNEKHPIVVLLVVLASAATVVGTIIAVAQYIGDDVLVRTRFEVNGREVRITTDNGKQIASKLFGESESWTIYVHRPIGHKGYDGDRLLIIYGSKSNNENHVAVIDKNLRFKNRYEFTHDSPYDLAQYDFAPYFLRTLRGPNDGTIYLVTYFGVRFPTAIVFLDDKLNEIKRLWHPGHVYDAAQINEYLYFWGKNNSFVRTFDKEPSDGQQMTDNHVAIFSISFSDLIKSKHPVLIGPHGQRRAPPQLPQFRVKWYYILDKLIPEYKGFDFDAKLDEEKLLFRIPSKWGFLFNSDGLEMGPLPHPYAKDTAPKALQIVPNDETGELDAASFRNDQSEIQEPSRRVVFEVVAVMAQRKKASEPNTKFSIGVTENGNRVDSSFKLYSEPLGQNSENKPLRDEFDDVIDEKRFTHFLKQMPGNPRLFYAPVKKQTKKICLAIYSHENNEDKLLDDECIIDFTSVSKEDGVRFYIGGTAESGKVHEHWVGCIGRYYIERCTQSLARSSAHCPIWLVHIVTETPRMISDQTVRQAREWGFEINEGQLSNGSNGFLAYKPTDMNQPVARASSEEELIQQLKALRAEQEAKNRERQIAIKSPADTIPPGSVQTSQPTSRPKQSWSEILSQIVSLIVAELPDVPTTTDRASLFSRCKLFHGDSATVDQHGTQLTKKKTYTPFSAHSQQDIDIVTESLERLIGVTTEDLSTQNDVDFSIAIAVFSSS